jgi:MFS transporter, UMF1 family
MEKERKRAQLGWYLYDFGNSAYAAVVLLAIYSAYFKGTVVGGAEGLALVGHLGGYRHAGGRDRVSHSGGDRGLLRLQETFPVLLLVAFMGVYRLCCSSSKKGIFFSACSSSSWRRSVTAQGQVFYNSLLTEVAEPHEIGRVSANGWAIGSAGGILCVVGASSHCIDPGTDLPVRGAFVFTAVFFLVSAIPLFLWVREKGEHNPLPEGRTISRWRSAVWGAPSVR